MTDSDTPLLWEHPLSPYAQKVKLALMEKNVTFEAVNLFSMDADDYQAFLQHSPRGEVPLLQHGDIALYDSSVILAYIEETWPAPPLLPTTPRQRAKVRLLEQAIGTHFEANTWGLSEVEHFGRAEGDAAQHLRDFGIGHIRRWYTWLDGQLADAEWFNGADFGWGDVCVIPFVNGAARFEIEPEPGTPLAAWFARVNARASVVTCREAASAAELDRETMTQALRSGFRRHYRDHRLEWMVAAGSLDIVEHGIEADNIRFSEPFA